MRTIRAVPLLLATLLAATACGAQVERSTAETATVPRCGQPVEYRAPERAVAYEAGSADKLFALGLGEKVRGYVMPPANPPVSESPWAADYAATEELSTDLLNRELVVDAGADLVVAGWRSGFSDERGITPELLDRLGIQSFMHTETCWNYPGFPERVTPLEGLYEDMRRLGAIFRVPERADDVVAGMQARVDAVTAAAPRQDPPPSVFLYDSGTDRPNTAGNQVPPNDIISLAGGRNVLADVDARWTDVGWETVVERQPEIIMILDYGDQSAEQKIDYLTSLPQLRSVPAIAERNFFVLDYNEGISGPRNIDGLERFGAYLREFRR
ncbi:ABC transporter (iron.B12.siderophore.hemin), periplasmic substrate-binding component [Pseudonocardia sp. Ae168_Ps1]|uniref:ABC transporter substrate-binding protein n=1 Tax=unclassified Pseudonocardia TaxID=2619320 RepID=UPI00094AA38A|nr:MULTISPECIES: ABC transporter substrate-binding protein [unclassified Pseudonocardia]OLL76316.1 ABC transporter (iron.B12.siderophore.hemin), periplasmic substrate-binding component [Pseudonocardia sp. Ae150A_Ps1]OLL82315.1 ABC transporter (iron.B12.siderophore.hemin), periplasmic substrate-binding component [Pseudonocardia sp. Ae168_Ps1]OLL83569.1 ABC transporter (iron.B12.siderophore.hemin), periplasmic substrate-binding component [Pseudonocardia sp. Ae263_Ps1]OLL90391.1 ABC transporter (i